MFKKFLVVIMFVGLGLIITGFVLIKGDFNNVVNSFTMDEDYEFKELVLEDDFDYLKIDLISHNINFKHSDDDKLKVEYYESENDKVNIKVEGNTLKLKSEYKKKYRFFNFRFKSPKVSNVDIYLPKNEYQNIDVELISGDLKINNFIFNEISIKTTSGDISLSKLNVNNKVVIDLVSGDFHVEDLNVTNDLNVETVSGYIKINTVSSKSISAKTVSGDIYVNDLITNSIKTETISGDIDLNINGNKDDFKAILNITSGTIRYGGIKLKSQTLNTDKDKSINADAVSGNITINFKND